MEQFITLENMRFFAYHGVFEQERQIGNWYEVSLKIKVNFMQALETDDVKDTINYADMFDIIAGEMHIPSNLLEHVAGRIMHAIQQKFPGIEELEICLSKLHPPVNGEMGKASVLLKWKKEDSSIL